MIVIFGFTVYAVVKSLLPISIVAAIFWYIGAGIVPLGFTISFVIMQLHFGIGASWWWLVLTLFADFMSFGETYGELIRGYYES